MANTQPNRIYAQILYDRVHWIFTGDVLPEYNENHIAVIDITDITPQPKEGDSYAGGVFAPYIHPTVISPNQLASSPLG